MHSQAQPQSRKHRNDPRKIPGPRRRRGQRGAHPPHHPGAKAECPHGRWLDRNDPSKIPGPRRRRGQRGAHPHIIPARSAECPHGRWPDRNDPSKIPGPRRRRGQRGAHPHIIPARSAECPHGRWLLDDEADGDIVFDGGSALAAVDRDGDRVGAGQCSGRRLGRVVQVAVALRAAGQSQRSARQQ